MFYDLVTVGALTTL